MQNLWKEILCEALFSKTEMGKILLERMSVRESKERKICELCNLREKKFGDLQKIYCILKVESFSVIKPIKLYGEIEYILERNMHSGKEENLHIEKS